jgi:hypothetical protein
MVVSDPEKTPQSSGNSRLGTAGWIAILALAGFLVAAIAYSIYTWNEISGVSISAIGWLFMCLGVVLTLAVGAGLMALLFYSSRKGRDF